VNPVRRDKLDWHTMITTQQAVAKRFATVTPDASMAEACAHQPQESFWTLNILGSPCSTAMATHNLKTRLPEHFPFPLSWLLVGLLLMSLPGRRGKEGVLDSIMVLVAWGSIPVLFSWTTPIPVRYQLQLSPLYFLPVPVGVARLVQTLSSTPRWGTAAAVLVGFILVFWDPQGRRSPESLHYAREQSQQHGVLFEIKQKLGPNEPIVDCSGTGIAVGLLPEHLGGHHPLRDLTDPSPCQRWVQKSPGNAQRWMLLADRLQENKLKKVMEDNDWSLEAQFPGHDYRLYTQSPLPIDGGSK